MATALAQSMACPKVVVMQAGASLSESRCTKVSLFRVEMLNILCSFLLNYLIDSFHLVTKYLLSTVITLCIDYKERLCRNLLAKKWIYFLHNMIPSVLRAPDELISNFHVQVMWGASSSRMWGNSFTKTLAVSGQLKVSQVKGIFQPCHSITHSRIRS